MTSMNKKKIVFLIGYPGSGKSTYINKHYPDFIKISSDKYIEEYAEQNDKTYSEVFQDFIKIATKNMNEEFDYALEQRDNMVIDKMNLTEKSRNSFINRLPQDVYDIEYVYMDTPIDTLMKRNEDRKKHGRNVPEFIFEFDIELPENYKGVTLDGR